MSNPMGKATSQAVSIKITGSIKIRNVNTPANKEPQVKNARDSSFLIFASKNSNMKINKNPHIAPAKVRAKDTE